MVCKSLSYSYSILVDTPDTRDFLVTCWRHSRNICYEDATRKLLPLNLGSIQLAVTSSSLWLNTDDKLITRLLLTPEANGDVFDLPDKLHAFRIRIVKSVPVTGGFCENIL